MSTPTREASLTILRRRAKALAEVREDELGDESLDSVVVLEIAHERVGVSLSALDEIAPLSPIAELSGMPGWLPGIAQVRGRIVPVLDLHAWLKMAGPSSPRYLAVVRATVGAMAILVDGIGDVRDIRAKDIAESIALDRARGLRAATKDLLSLLDIDVLLSHPDLVVDHATNRESA